MLSDACVTLKLKKCSFFTDTMDYLGHVIRPGKLEIATPAIEAIKGVKQLINVTELRSFLGLCNIFRLFVPNFPRISAPQNKKLQKDHQFTLGDINDEETAAMKTLQEKLTSPQVVTLAKPTGRYVVDTECEKQVGCVLLQEQDKGAAEPTVYLPRTLNNVESTYERHIVNALQ